MVWYTIVKLSIVFVWYVWYGMVKYGMPWHGSVWCRMSGVGGTMVHSRTVGCGPDTLLQGVRCTAEDRGGQDYQSLSSVT